MSKPKKGKKKVIKEDAKAKKRAKAKQKAEAKKRKKNDPNKVKIDPTFGIKNKKGSRNRKFVQNSRNNMNAEEIRKNKERIQKKKEKEYMLRLKREEEALFKTVDEPKRKNKNSNETDEESEQKIEVDDEYLLNNCAPDELDLLIDKLREKFADRTDLTPVNEQTFKEWLLKKEQERIAKKEAKVKKKLQKKGKKRLSGRELFSLTPNIFKDDENAQENIVFEKEEEKKQTQTQTQTDTKQLDHVIDESLFLDDMDDMNIDDMNDMNNGLIQSMDYVFKCMDNNNNSIVCLDNDFNDIVFGLDGLTMELLDKIGTIIKEGEKEKKDVMITVSELNTNDKVVKNVIDAKVV